MTRMQRRTQPQSQPRDERVRRYQAVRDAQRR
jgi:hypothetical protein